MAENMSNLENTIRNQVGINIIVRHQLIKAYTSTNAKAEVKSILAQNKHQIDEGLYGKLLILADNENALV